ncbi:hypothetical protein E3N88_05908 [Mikania micrantha]|uniref:Reverse transcriptase zinc-binding domain-containing protein n=1 Tax=Mikania micrantha TaxID=192012 RepID=A0A5N6PN57_9ASTR|nr:hypothetical protein E3N88_05908 [Mikania micrantha]
MVVMADGESYRWCVMVVVATKIESSVATQLESSSDPSESSTQLEKRAGAPNNVLNCLERIRRNFLWNGPSDKSKIRWISWDVITATKDKGGLGLGKLKEINMAMLAKWWWKLKVEKGNLWTRVIWGIHHCSRSWSYIPVNVRVPGIWKNIHKIGDDLLKYNIDLPNLMIGKVGYGDRIRFWVDKWLGEVSLHNMFPLLFSKESNKLCTIGERYQRLGGGITWFWSWEAIGLSAQEEMELNNLSRLLMDVTITMCSDTCCSIQISSISTRRDLFVRSIAP